MLTVSLRGRRTVRVLPVLVLLGFGWAPAACSQQLPGPVAPPDAEPPAEAAAAPAEPQASPAARPQPEPPDGVWLTDENGLRYYVEKLRKEEGRYLRLEGGKVRTMWGVTIPVVKEDEEYFYYRVYNSDDVEAQVERQAQKPDEPGPEEIRAIEASYKAELRESDRLRLAPFSQGLPVSGQWRNGFAIADVNGDGHLDIVHGPARKSLGGPSLFLGDGKGSWRPWREASFPRLPYDYGDAAAADLNGDGHLDVVLGMHLKGVVALLGDGRGGFRNWSDGLDLRGPDGALGFSSRAVEIVDWNRDGRPDILALGEGPHVQQQRLPAPGADGARQGQEPRADSSYGAAVYLNQGDGTWRKQNPGTEAGGVFGDALVVADFNGDGRQDFATGSGIMGRKDLVNLAREDGGWSSVEIGPMRPQSYVRAVAAADFDGDGRSDLAVGLVTFELKTWRTVVDVYLPRAEGRWERRVLLAEPGREGVTALGVGDLDGDGQPDLVALSGAGKPFVFLGDGKGGFSREKAEGITPPPGGCRGYFAALADLDRDGTDELVAGFAGEASPMNDPDRCPSGGSLQAWDAAAANRDQQSQEKSP